MNHPPPETPLCRPGKYWKKVGGHPRKVSRKSGGGAGGGTGAGASAPRDDWRLTAEQKATLAEAYSDEPGTERYVPDAVSGWKRQKNPWATGTVRGKRGGLVSVRASLPSSEGALPSAARQSVHTIDVVVADDVHRFSESHGAFFLLVKTRTLRPPRR